jgi:hypothetical protein
MGESLRVTMVYEPGEDGSRRVDPGGQRRVRPGAPTREEARGERDRREAEAMHST